MIALTHRSRSATCLSFALLASSLSVQRASAEARFVIQARGAAFSDTTVVAPQGGNAATTLGGQRKAALQYAADLWGARLDSKVPIVLDAVFRARGCTDGGAVLAAAGAVSLFSGLMAGAGDPSLWYPSALANKLAERDLDPSEPEIGVEINLSIDEECRATFHGFYYGFDGKPGMQVDLVQVILHELAHGLGFSSYVDLRTGVPEKDDVDVFTDHIVDVTSNKSWRELRTDERRSSALSVRNVAFRGAHTVAAASQLLEAGTPRLNLTPTPPGYLGAVGDTGTRYPSIEGAVRVAGNLEGCGLGGGELMGALVVVRPNCSATELEANLMAQGAAGVLYAFPAAYAQPAASLAVSRPLRLPSLTLSVGDAELVRSALDRGSLYGQMRWDERQRVGADARGRPLLFATDPLNEGSSVSHFEQLARPDLLMEPFIGAPTHALDLTVPLMIDLGWGPYCGNGKLDAGEQCDEGPANSDSAANACRELCQKAFCGDGVVDQGEACDDGSANSDTLADACRSTCQRARCGDGVLDRLELCDQGTANDDVRPDACRSDCRAARCGDGVVDHGETCDGDSDCARDCTAPPEAPIGAPDDAWADPWAMTGATREQKHASGGCSLLRGRSLSSHAALLFGLGCALLTRRRRRPFARAAS